jgi:hypothetical protein
MTPAKFPCHATVSSHQYHADVICHAIAVDRSGRPYALVEYDNGDARPLYLDEHYSIRLGDACGSK